MLSPTVTEYINWLLRQPGDSSASELLSRSKGYSVRPSRPPVYAWEGIVLI